MCIYIACRFSSCIVSKAPKSQLLTNADKDTTQIQRKRKLCDCFQLKFPVTSFIIVYA